MITLLDAKLYLLSVKKSAFTKFMHPIVKNLLFRDNRHFFSLTENSTEISIIADQNTRADFIPFADEEVCTFCPDIFRALVKNFISH